MIIPCLEGPLELVKGLIAILRNDWRFWEDLLLASLTVFKIGDVLVSSKEKTLVGRLDVVGEEDEKEISIRSRICSSDLPRNELI